MSKYKDIYSFIRNEIQSNQLKAGDRLPSIRRASELYSVSRTTIQNAYFELAADGFIISEPQSGYYVSYTAGSTTENSQTETKSSSTVYNFEGLAADKSSFDFSLWRRYMKNALKEDERLLSYSEAQGEPELLNALSDYIREKRNVIASPSRIVIGAGVQSLLSIFASLIEEKGTVSFPDKSFIQGSGIFGDYGFKIRYRYKNANIIYVSPSHMTRWGEVMPNKRRLELVSHAAKNNSLIIEDDYDSDFLYNSRPAPSLHALAGGSNVVYIGSFSRLLLPSIRISFMVLTEELAEKYHKNIVKYAQTASKTEQIALCSFIRDGHLNAQIRKTRRFYTAKAKAFEAVLRKEFPDSQISTSENMLQVIMTINFSKNPECFEKAGIKLFTENYNHGKITLVLSPSGIAEKDFKAAAAAVKSVAEQ